jgi:hypothetical protein
MRFGPPLRLGSSDRLADVPEPLVERVVRRPLNRVLAFLGRGIDDVVNDPIVKNQVYGYYKLHRQVGRAGEVRELERQWNRTA